MPLTDRQSNQPRKGTTSLNVLTATLHFRSSRDLQPVLRLVFERPRQSLAASALRVHHLSLCAVSASGENRIGPQERARSACVPCAIASLVYLKLLRILCSRIAAWSCRGC